MPAILDTPEFRDVLARWKAYRGSKYKPAGLQSFLTRASKRAADHGLPALITAFERTMANGTSGWDYDSMFATPRASPTAAHGDGPRTRNGNAIVPFFPPARQA